MALVTCPDCKSEISDQAASCIKCGRPMSRDLSDQPAAGSAEAVKKGRQRSKLRNDLGMGIALIAIIGAIFAGAATSVQVGAAVAFIGVGIAVYVAYGS